MSDWLLTVAVVYALIAGGFVCGGIVGHELDVALPKDRIQTGREMLLFLVFLFLLGWLFFPIFAGAAVEDFRESRKVKEASRT